MPTAKTVTILQPKKDCLPHNPRSGRCIRSNIEMQRKKKRKKIQHDGVYLEDMMSYSSSACERHTGFLMSLWLPHGFWHQHPPFRINSDSYISRSRSMASVHHKMWIKSVPYTILMNFVRNWVRCDENNVFCCFGPVYGM